MVRNIIDAVAEIIRVMREVVAEGLGVGGHALFQVPRLADVEHLALGIEHPVDAGPLVEPAQIVADHQMPGARRGVRSTFLVEAPTLAALGVRHLPAVTHAVTHGPILPRAARNRNRFQV